MTTEVGGLAKIISVFNKKRIIYASSKSIDPYERNIFSPISREDITKLLRVASNGHLKNKIINLPNYRSIPKLIIPRPFELTEDVIGPPIPFILQPNRSANFST